VKVLGREIPDDDIRQIAGARCWVEDGYIVKASKVRDVGTIRRWRAEKPPEEAAKVD